MYIGAHESAAGGPYKAVDRALEDECASLQLFTKNNNRWNQRMWTDEEAEKFRQRFEESGIQGLMSHTSYLINLCSKTESTVEKSVEALADELTRCAKLGIPYLVLHPGSHTGQGEKKGLELIVENTQRVFDREQNGEWSDVTLLFENMAGQGTSLGYKFEHLAHILEQLDSPSRTGVCFDTCHAHAAGYDLTMRTSYEEVWETFDEIIGLEWLKTFHLNGSQKPLGSRVDRHDHIGEGHIGEDAFRFLVNDERFAEHPAVVETPSLENGDRSFYKNIEKLRSLES